MKTIGYKAMSPDMTCRGYQFELGKTYTIDNDKPLELCTDSGFHFCLDLEDVFDYYNYKHSRIFEIETNSDVFIGGNKSITKSLTIKRELTREDLANYQFQNDFYNIYFGNYTDEELLKIKGIEHIYNRAAVVDKMKDLDLMFKTFKNDESCTVRQAVVWKMKDLDLMFETFKDDEYYEVREAVARKMKDLDLMFKTFKDDRSYVVREAVVEKMTDLDLMFETFKYDEFLSVRKTARMKIKKSNKKLKY